MLRMTSVFRSIHKWFGQNPNRICQGPKLQCTCTLLTEVIQIMIEIQIPENAEEETPVIWCQSKWHDMTHFSSGLLYMLRCWFFSPFTICGAHNIRILDLGKHLTQEFELYNLYPVFFTCHTICENLENEEHF